MPVAVCYQHFGFHSGHYKERSSGIYFTGSPTNLHINGNRFPMTGICLDPTCSLYRSSLKPSFLPKMLSENVAPRSKQDLGPFKSEGHSTARRCI
jgi:hypothetical protein